MSKEPTDKFTQFIGVCILTLVCGGAFELAVLLESQDWPNLIKAIIFFPSLWVVFGMVTHVLQEFGLTGDNKNV